MAHLADLRAEAPGDLVDALCASDPMPALDARYGALLEYAVKVTKSPHACARADVDALRARGATDVEIHATVQVAAYFNYINRVADALGVDPEPT